MQGNMGEDEEPGPAKSKKAMERPAKKARKSGTKVGLLQLGFCFGSCCWSTLLMDARIDAVVMTIRH